jgi:hypothetical protein
MLRAETELKGSSVRAAAARGKRFGRPAEGRRKLSVYATFARFWSTSDETHHLYFYPSLS